MEKMKFETISLVDKNIDKIEQIFPGVVTEVKDADGTIRKAVDFEALKAELSKDIVEGRECYEFTWAGKNEAKYEAAKPIRKTLRPCKEESKNWDTTQNLYIEGDNLDVLKLLQESYLNKVKMIYIDPPYNTGNDFVYADDFRMKQGEYEDLLDLTDEEGNRMIRNTDSNGRFHSDWCSMIYLRLKLARNLLTDDGVIFISIDDNEVANLKKICDEVFGRDNFIEIFSWQKTTTPPNLSKKTKKSCEYILLYQKKECDILRGLVKNSKSSNGLMNQTNPIQVLTFPQNIVKTKLKDGVYNSGKYGTDSYDIQLLEDTEVKNGLFIKPIVLQGKFKWSQEYLNNAIHDGVHIFIQTIAFSPSYEKDEYEPEKPWNIINRSFGVGTNENASADLKELMGKEVFSYPKPISLIKYLINFIAKDKDIIMDFFSGSATTAHAVFELNISGNEQKFIMVQFPENLDENLKEASDPKMRDIIQNAINLCDQLKVPHLLTEIARERIRRAGEKIKQEYGEKAENLDIGFRVFKLDSTNMKDVYYTPAELTQDLLAKTESNIKDDRTDMDLLYGCLLDWGLELSMPHETKQIDGVAVHYVNQTDLIACFNTDVSEAVIRKIAADKPLRVVFRDSCFKNVSDKTNVDELFKAISPETQIKVI